MYTQLASTVHHTTSQKLSTHIPTGIRQGKATPIQTFYAITRKMVINKHILSTISSTSKSRNTHHSSHQRETGIHTQDSRSHIELKLELVQGPSLAGVASTTKESTLGDRHL